MKGERWQTDRDSFEARAKELGAEVIFADAGETMLINCSK